MKLSRTTAYAIQASLLLAESPSQEPVPCSQLAAAGQMPERFLLQILRAMVTHGILKSTRGVEGGYALERKPHEISLLDLIEAVDGPIGSDQPLHGGLPEKTRHKLQATLDGLIANVRRELGDVKLSHLLSATSGEGH